MNQQTPWVASFTPFLIAVSLLLFSNDSIKVKFNNDFSVLHTRNLLRTVIDYQVHHSQDLFRSVPKDHSIRILNLKDPIQGLGEVKIKFEQLPNLMYYLAQITHNSDVYFSVIGPSKRGKDGRVNYRSSRLLSTRPILQEKSEEQQHLSLAKQSLIRKMDLPSRTALPDFNSNLTSNTVRIQARKLGLAKQWRKLRQLSLPQVYESVDPVVEIMNSSPSKPGKEEIDQFENYEKANFLHSIAIRNKDSLAWSLPLLKKLGIKNKLLHNGQDLLNSNPKILKVELSFLLEEQEKASLETKVSKIYLDEAHKLYQSLIKGSREFSIHSRIPYTRSLVLEAELFNNDQLRKSIALRFSEGDLSLQIFSASRLYNSPLTPSSPEFIQKIPDILKNPRESRGEWSRFSFEASGIFSVVKLQEEVLLYNSLKPELIRVSQNKWTRVELKDPSPFQALYFKTIDRRFNAETILRFTGFPESQQVLSSSDGLNFAQGSQNATFARWGAFGDSWLHTLTNQKSFVFCGGSSGSREEVARYQDCYQTFDGVNVQAIAPIPSRARHSAGLFRYNNQLYMIGGCFRFAANSCFNDFYSSNNLKEWRKLPDPAFSPRGAFALETSPEGVFLFGGSDGEEVYADFYQSRDGISWIAKQSLPDDGRVHAELFEHQGNLILVGGQTKSGYYPSQVWIYKKKEASLELF